MVAAQTIVMYLALAMVAMGMVLNIAAAGYHFYAEGDAKPLVDSTIGVLFTSDKTLDDSVTQLSDPELMASIPDMYRDGYAASLRERIGRSMLLILFITFLTYKVVMWVLGWQKENFMTHFLVILGVFMFLIVAQLLYVGLSFGQLMWPFQGVWNLLNHPEIVTSLGDAYIPSIPDMNATMNVTNATV